jgi:hypothetical protein
MSNVVVLRIVSNSTMEPPAERNSIAGSKTKTRLHILSASYGPADGRKLYDGKVVDYAQRRSETYVPHSRDVLPFLRALMMCCGASQSQSSSSTTATAESGDVFDEIIDDEDLEFVHDGELGAAATNTSSTASVTNYASANRCTFPLMDGRPMNAVFGDPCPGTTKLLHIEYIFRDYFYDDDVNRGISTSDDDQNFDAIEHLAESKTSEGGEIKGRTARRSHSYHCTTSRIFISTFREHERVVLKRQDPLYPLATPGGDEVSGASNVKQQHTSDAETMQVDDGHSMTPAISSQLSTLSKQQWKLAPTTSEITLPIILPFLTVRQRAKCQLVCTSWRDIVLEKGIAVVVDINDAGLFPKTSIISDPSVGTATAATAPVTDLLTSASHTQHIPSSPLHLSTSFIQQNSNDHQSSRSLLRGLLNHSHSSLEALVLNDFISLQPTMDLHPALPYLRKLQRLDISRIPTITDETLRLISTYIGPRLEVLYMKGLKQITNDGIVHLVQSCCNLRVLDVSQLHQLDDTAGIAIGHYLTKLEVLHGKDNYKLTNRSVDLITRNCRNLIQVTLWGSIRLTHISFHDDEEFVEDVTPVTFPPASIVHRPPMKLVLLNLWGCHNLTDAAAQHLTGLPHLRSLCVSECHRLTDQFVHGICQSLTRLLHLQLRYVRRITDASLKSLSQYMPWLYSLDVSFCTKLTIEGVSQLLIERCNSLSELRLYSCRSLNIESMDNVGTGGASAVSGGHQLARALQTVRGRSTLSFLDLRECQQYETYARDAIWIRSMVGLGFNESLRGLFIRPAIWNDDVRKQLVANVAF